jgi:hypothetical protein
LVLGKALGSNEGVLVGTGDGFVVGSSDGVVDGNSLALFTIVSTTVVMKVGYWVGVGVGSVVVFPRQSPSFDAAHHGVQFSL